MSMYDQASNIAIDNWLQSAGQWTKTILGENSNVYVGALSDEVIMPYVLWELSSMEVLHRGITSFETNKTLTATIVAENPLQELNWMTKLLETIGTQPKLALEGSSLNTNPKYVHVTSCRGNVTKPTPSQPKRECTVTLTLSGRTALTTSEVDVMQKIQFGS
ncbi:hypothetical protein J2Z32_001366 [Paenibacillus turicensis]|uniref:Uncharacterized protein n=1 Tax=Paenibacillus turicensis TaxID=160487 RepID=A0ABS4FQ86_9BACL|nr:hypothetical protein [Paenibacillus turicensis]MBP1904742.1 hypothetical protein [Paenibacillus turicensis]